MPLRNLTILLIAITTCFISSCSKECNIRDYVGTYQVDASDKACVKALTTDEVKFSIFEVIEIPFLIIDDKTQFQLTPATTEDTGGGCGFSFASNYFPAGESAVVNIEGNNLNITYTKPGSRCEASLRKK
jgi:hypothetical protein